MNIFKIRRIHGIYPQSEWAQGIHEKINIFLMQKPRETTMKKMSITTKNIHPYEESCKH